MISCRQIKSYQGFTLLEVTITVGILSFLLFIAYATIFSLGFRMRLELLGGYLAPGSKSQVNQQILISQVNRFFLEAARSIRSAKQINTSSSRVIIVENSGSIVEYSLKEYSTDGKVMKTIVRSKNGQGERVIVQGIEDFKIKKSSNLVTIEIRAVVAGKEQIFQTSLFKRSPSK
ncbi:competence type IV pilus minor pilin ComGF [Candidatus Caldatribacterium sp. SIUC1]|uniref:competence type IV pilus minor pilin ComGF n=1 Tax=Candidatus Caldatribacterium sp. SIUC1 TaxID=3418365 RepID=UPI003F691FED